MEESKAVESREILIQRIETGLDADKRYDKQAIISLLKMPSDIPVNECASSNVKAYGYDPASRVLKVVFSNGSAYGYLNVPPMEFDMLEKAPSKGRVIQEVKASHAFTRL